MFELTGATMSFGGYAGGYGVSIHAPAGGATRLHQGF